MTANGQTMLKLQHFLKATCMAAVALTALNCSDDDPVESPPKDITTIVASIEGISIHTRTSITEDPKGVWNKNDAFGVFHTPAGKSTPAIAKFTCPDADGTANSTTFTGKLEGGATPSYAIYPHQDNMSISGTTVTMELPKEFAYTEASNGPMYADASEPASGLNFKHLTGLLKLKVGSNIPATAKKFIITADKAIAGTCKTDLKTANPTLAVEATGSSKAVTISLNITEAGLRTFYIPIPVGTYGTLSATLLNADGTEAYPPKEWKDLTIVRSGMYSTAFDYTEIDASTGNIDEAIMEAIPTGDQVAPVTTDIEITGAIDASSTPSIAIPVNANSNVNLSLATAPVTANGALELKDANNSTASPATAVNTVTVSIPKVENAATAPSFTITMPKTTVVLAAAETGGATYGKVIAKTAANTLVVAKGVTVNELIVEGGNVRVEGTIKAISKAEALTSPVYLIKEAGAVLPENTTGFVIIDATAYEMKAALANGENYVLTADADITSANITVPEGKTATLDLNGYTVTASNSTDESGRITVEGNFTLKDSKETGKIIASQDYASGSYDSGVIKVIGENARMTMESGYINAVRSDAANKGQYGISLREGGDFTMTGGKIEAGWFAIAGNGNDKTQDSEIKIEGGELISTADYVLYLPQSGKTTISGGSITGACGGIGVRNGSLEIKGDARITSKGTGSTGDWKDGTGNTGNAVISVGNGNANTYGDCTVTISGGTFTAEGNAAVIAKRTTDARHNITVNISGGTFSDVTALDHLTETAKADVTLNRDIEITKPVILDKTGTDITVNLNGHDIVNKTSIDNFTTVFKVFTGTLTIEGSGNVKSLEEETDIDGFRMPVWVVREEAVVNIKGGSFYNYQKKNTQVDLIYTEHGTINISGGTFESGCYKTKSEKRLYWVLNRLDQSTTACINVTGGTFVNFNPAYPNTELDANTTFVSEGYEVKCDGTVTNDIYSGTIDERKEYIVSKKQQQ